MTLDLRALEKKFGGDIVIRLSDYPRQFDTITTGSMQLDIATGVGGIVRKCVTEIWGPENSGKTTLAIHIGTNVVKNGGNFVFIDMEKKMSGTWLRKIFRNYGLQIEEGAEPLERFVVIRPDTGSDALDIAFALIPHVDAIAVDSVYAMLTKQEKEQSSASDMHVGTLARMMSSNIKGLVSDLGRSNCALIFLNQLRFKIGVMGDTRTRPGGQAIPQAAIMSIHMKNRGSIQKNKGTTVRAKIVKNQAAAPFATVDLNILFDRGFDRDNDAIDTAITLGVVEQGGPWYSFDDIKEKGKEPFITSIKESGRLDELVKLTRQKMLEYQASQAV